MSHLFLVQFAFIYTKLVISASSGFASVVTPAPRGKASGTGDSYLNVVSVAGTVPGPLPFIIVCSSGSHLPQLKSQGLRSMNVRVGTKPILVRGRRVFWGNCTGQHP